MIPGYCGFGHDSPQIQPSHCSIYFETECLQVYHTAL
jgi:hypothetical protein